MLRTSVALIVLGCTAAFASAQTFYGPPPEMRIYNPYDPALDLQAIQRLYVLSRPAVIVNVEAAGDVAVDVSGRARVTGPKIPGQLYPHYESIDIDPQSGESLFFRMSELQDEVAQPRQQPVRIQLTPARPVRQPLPEVRRVAEPEAPKGGIIIRPSRNAPVITADAR